MFFLETIREAPYFLKAGVLRKPFESFRRVLVRLEILIGFTKGYPRRAGTSSFGSDLRLSQKAAYLYVVAAISLEVILTMTVISCSSS